MSNHPRKIENEEMSFEDLGRELFGLPRALDSTSGATTQGLIINIEQHDFRDPLGHPLSNCLPYIELCCRAARRVRGTGIVISQRLFCQNEPFSRDQDDALTPEGAMAVAGKIIQTLRNEGLDPKSGDAYTALSVVLKAIGS